MFHPPYTCQHVHVEVEELLLVELQRSRDGERPRLPAPPAVALVLLPKLVLLSREVLLNGIKLI